MESLTARELDRCLERGDDLQLVDVRERWEWETAALPAAQLVPMGELPERVGELDAQRATVMICHHGMRSAMAGQWLERAGFTRIINLTGGMDAWSLEVDPAMPRY